MRAREIGPKVRQSRQNIQKLMTTDVKVMNANMVQSNNPIQEGGKGRVTMEPKACIAPPESNGKPQKPKSNVRMRNFNLCLWSTQTAERTR